eukprot:CAMPEP_0197662026 /NCGR_PEP_ID=MMETSP1338-20131121/51875_1 /TAXON_ID=43686 ORGANISM="Pelagodinium beii, Strain RCC1491" /NCGR_SAMPLE_ID=MMETSP1338 /ASSEMBLY_ACC=CAM_ASM_000754 /LENGTH=257 /DNA_ID=CAMNT_0043239703 /DNA_START=238 /DNA_END=1008 /DNA_ORIENTATION=-
MEGHMLLQLNLTHQKNKTASEDDHDDRTSRSLLFQAAAMLRELPKNVYDQIAFDVPYSDFSEEVETFPERKPWLFNVLVATFKTWMADFVVQVSEASSIAERGGSFAWFNSQRSFTFAMFGLIYVGLIEWVLYVSTLSVALPHAVVFGNEPLADKMNDSVGQADLLIQICYDNFLVNPLVYFPIFYLIKGTMAARCSGKTPENGSPSSMAAGLARYGENFWADNLTSCVVWVPVDFLVFAAPMYLRMPLSHAFSFLW